MLIIHSPRCLGYAAEGHPESPERVRAAAEALHKRQHTWQEAQPCSEQDILRVHTARHLEAVRTGTFSDVDSPVYPDIYELARLSAGAAVLAAEKALAGERALSLMRPPGHHAERDRVMGFCYFNNIGIAVAKILSEAAERSVEKVAILDFDCHHGNGTENIFLGNQQVLFVSLHQSPCYPGTGLAENDNCLNYPLPPGTEPEKFLSALDGVIERIRAFQPGALAVSAGFDAYKEDPITDMRLEIDTYRDIGERVDGFCRSVRGKGPLPCFCALEGGYSRDFSRCVEAFVDGLDTR